MDKEQAALKVFEEELGELAIEILKLQQNVSKAIRFGVNEQRDLPTSNKDRIEEEWNDLLGSLRNLANVGVELKPNVAAVYKKMAKIEKYNDYSKLLGKVEA